MLILISQLPVQISPLKKPSLPKTSPQKRSQKKPLKELRLRRLRRQQNQLLLLLLSLLRVRVQCSIDKSIRALLTVPTDEPAK